MSKRQDLMFPVLGSWRLDDSPVDFDTEVGKAWRKLN